MYNKIIGFESLPILARPFWFVDKYSGKGFYKKLDFNKSVCLKYHNHQQKLFALSKFTHNFKETDILEYNTNITSNLDIVFTSYDNNKENKIKIEEKCEFDNYEKTNDLHINYKIKIFKFTKSNYNILSLDLDEKVGFSINNKEKEIFNNYWYLLSNEKRETLNEIKKILNENIKEALIL
jgi:hypothetical protein